MTKMTHDQQFPACPDGILSQLNDSLQCSRVRRLQDELAGVCRECVHAQADGQVGNVFFLLRKKWLLMQQLFEAENELRLLAAAASEHSGDVKEPLPEKSQLVLRTRRE